MGNKKNNKLDIIFSNSGLAYFDSSSNSIVINRIFLKDVDVYAYVVNHELQHYLNHKYKQGWFSDFILDLKTIFNIKLNLFILKHPSLWLECFKIFDFKKTKKELIINYDLNKSLFLIAWFILFWLIWNYFNSIF